MEFQQELVQDSVYLIREAAACHGRVGLLWSAGKDSTLLLWLCRKAFLGDVPFPVVHIDTGFKLPEIYTFRDRLTEEWGLDLVVWRNGRALSDGMCPDDHETLACCGALKTEALRQAIRELGFDAVLVGIRRDEHGVRAKERYVSPRDADFAWRPGEQPPELWDMYAGAGDADHVRIHPLLHMTEADVWRVTAQEGVPVNPLYFAQDGWRYRSIGCAPCCEPIASDAGTIPEIIAEVAAANSAERAGRAQDKEGAFVMQKLRSLGYM